MRCRKCNCPMDGDMLFCPMCGAANVVVPPEDEPAASTADKTKLYESESPPLTRTSPPTKVYFPKGDKVDSMTKAYAPPVAPPENFDINEEKLQVHISPEQVDQRRTEAVALPVIAPPSAEPAPRKNVTYHDGFVDSPDTDGSDEVKDKPEIKDKKNKKEAPRLTGDKKASVPARIGSIFLCVILSAILLSTAVLGALHLSMTEGSVRDAVRGTKLSDISFVTDGQEVSLAEYILSSTDSSSLEAFGLDKKIINSVLNGEKVKNLIENVAVDLVDRLLRGRAGSHLNSEYICAELTKLNEEINSTLNEAAGYPVGEVTLFDVQQIEKDINGGYLSILSLDSDQYFRQRYGAGSWALLWSFTIWPVIALGGISLLLVLLLFPINRKNIVSAFRFNSAVMLIIGGFCAVFALGCVVLTFFKKMSLISALLRSYAMWLGVIGIGLAALGIIFLTVGRIIVNKTAKAG